MAWWSTVWHFKPDVVGGAEQVVVRMTKFVLHLWESTGWTGTSAPVGLPWSNWRPLGVTIPLLLLRRVCGAWGQGMISGPD